jgi:hypothetical protein
MAMLLYPAVALLWPKLDGKVLIVGPRTEDDIFFAKALGLKNPIGLDLFSYSPLIQVGDAHRTLFKNSSIDLVIVGWVLPYTEKPGVLIQEMLRILRPDGYLGFSWLEVLEGDSLKSDQNRANLLNKKQEILDLLRLPRTKKILHLETVVDNGKNHAYFIKKH